MIKVKYSVSNPYSNMVFVEMGFFNGGIQLNVDDPLVKPIYDILVRYDLRGDLGFPKVLTTSAGLNNTLRVENLLQCFDELEAKGYLNATNLRQSLMNEGCAYAEDSSGAPRCSI